MLDRDVSKVLVDHRWLLVALRESGRDVEVRPSLCEAWLDLYAVGRIGYFDGINYHSGRFEVTGERLSLLDIRSTSIGYVGGDPHLIATMKAMGRLSAVSGSAVHDGEPTTVGIRLVETLLELETGHCVLVFRRAGTVYADA